MMYEIKHIVYTSDLDLKKLVGDYQENAISVLDPRSAVYVATGIAAQNKEPVFVFVNSGNASRSAFSGMTEAFYRNLPIILITVGKDLDYSEKLKDVANSHLVISSIDELASLVDRKMPIHVELDVEIHTVQKKMFFALRWLSDAVTADDYIYFGQKISINIKDFPCKIVSGGMPNCNEGALANVLGASLAKKRRRYIGLVTETEFFHDMNTLGNININNYLVYIIFTNKSSDLIFNYADSLGFNVNMFEMDSIKTEDIKNILDNKKKSLILINGEL